MESEIEAASIPMAAAARTGSISMSSEPCWRTFLAAPHLSAAANLSPAHEKFIFRWDKAVALQGRPRSGSSLVYHLRRQTDALEGFHNAGTDDPVGLEDVSGKQGMVDCRHERVGQLMFVKNGLTARGTPNDVNAFTPTRNRH